MEFKKKVYKERGRSFRRIEIVLLVFSVVFFLTSTIMYMIKYDFNIHISFPKTYNVTMIASAMLFVVLYVILLIIMNTYNKKINFEQENDKAIINKCEDVLKKADYYSKDKIEWLLSCCEKRLQYSSSNKIVSAFKTGLKYFLPLPSLFAGVILERSSNEELIKLFSVLLLLFFFVVLCGIGVHSIIDSLSFPNDNCLRLLAQCLEYLKTETK